MKNTIQKAAAILEELSMMYRDGLISYLPKGCEQTKMELHLFQSPDYSSCAKKLSRLLKSTYRVDIHPDKLEMFLERELGV